MPGSFKDPKLLRSSPSQKQGITKSDHHKKIMYKVNFYLAKTMIFLNENVCHSAKFVDGRSITEKKPT